jgi:hypothetical protein
MTIDTTTCGRTLAVAVLAGTLALAGCGSSSNSPGVGEPPPPPPPPPPSSVTFPGLLLGLLAQTSDTSEPVAINGLTISFPNNDNPTLFDSVLARP